MLFEPAFGGWGDMQFFVSARRCNQVYVSVCIIPIVEHADFRHIYLHVNKVSTLQYIYIIYKYTYTYSYAYPPTDGRTDGWTDERTEDTYIYMYMYMYITSCSCCR